MGEEEEGLKGKMWLEMGSRMPASLQFEEEDGSDDWTRREGILYLRREA